jgi:hypothetical protein
MKTLYKPFLPALAIFGLLLGCGGDKDTKEESGGGSGAQGGGEKATDLAKFLPGKRISFTVREPDDPPEVQDNIATSTMLAQFELDGTITMGAVFEGKTLAVTDKKLTFKVDGLKVTLPNPFEEGEATMSFSSANPKVGDKFTIGETGGPKGMEATISAIEKGGKLELMAMPQTGFGQPEPGEPNPEAIGGAGGGIIGPDGAPAFGMGPNGEFAKSKHPAFMAHTWEPDRFSRNPTQPAIFGKDGTLTIRLVNGKTAKGTWEVAGPVVTLTYPNAKTGKEQSLKYRFLFGGMEIESSDGVEKFETLNLVPAPGQKHPKIDYQRPVK